MNINSYGIILVEGAASASEYAQANLFLLEKIGELVRTEALAGSAAFREGYNTKAATAGYGTSQVH